MKEGFLNTIREYLLTFDENIRERIIISLAKDDFEIISNIENAFLSDKHINAIIQELQLESIQEEIKDLHAEYYLELAELYAEGKTNKQIETLLSSDNQTFKKTVSLFPDEATFFKELSIAVDDKKTEQLKKGYAEIDEWLQSKKSSSNNDFARIVSIRRKIFRYAIAAAMVGVLIGGAYLRFFNTKLSDDNVIVNNDSVNNNKPDIADLEIPNLIEHSESIKSIIIDETSSGLASLNESVSIKSNGLSKQIDTLKNILEKTIQNNLVGNGQTYSLVSKQIDSLLRILNTYTYNYKTKKVVLNVPTINIVNNIISINPNNLSELYIKIEDTFYLIQKTETPIKLRPIIDRKLIDTLNYIINFSEL